MPSFSPKLLENTTHYIDIGCEATWGGYKYVIKIMSFNSCLLDLKYGRHSDYSNAQKFLKEYFARL